MWQKYIALVSGFEPFAQNTINPSWTAVDALPEEIHSFKVKKIRLPVAFSLAFIELEKAIGNYKPDLILCTGLAANRSELSLERVAINLSDARIADNHGVKPVDEPVVPGAPDAYFSNLPLKEILNNLASAGLQASISNTAGTFVCNYVMYHLMHWIVSQNPYVLGGFIHLPPLPEMVGIEAKISAIPLDSMILGLEKILETCSSFLYKRQQSLEKIV